MRNVRRHFRAGWAAPAGLLGCLGCSQVGLSLDPTGHGEGALPEVADDFAQPENRRGGAREAPPAIERLGSAGYRELDDRGRQRLVAVLARPAPERGDPAPDHGENGTPPPGAELPSGLNDLWMQFLSRVEPTAADGFIVQDIVFADEDGLIDYFLEQYGRYFDKGLVVPSKAWPRPSGAPLLHVCWSSGNVTLAEQQRAEQLVQASWPKMTELVFNFSNAGTMNSCASAAPDGSWEILIRQDSSVPNGTSVYGTDSLTGTVQDPNDAAATMRLPTMNSVNATRSWVDHTVVHEFGHAIGLAHEQLRLEYNWDDPDLGAPPPASAPRNCPQADRDIIYIPPGQFLNDRLTPADVDARNNVVLTAQTVGDFDDVSIMYYCQATEALEPDHPRMSEVSVGDIASAQFLYSTNRPSREGIFQYSSWQNIPVQLTFQGVNVNVNASPTVATKATNVFRRVGLSYTASATSTSVTTPLKCNTRARPLGVFTYDAIVPPVGFSVSPIVVDCFDPAGLVAALN